MEEKVHFRSEFKVQPVVARKSRQQKFESS